MQPATPISANRLFCAVLLALFVCSAAITALKKDIAQGFDELAHVSYVAELQAGDRAWPRLENLRMLDAKTFRFTKTANYLNHTPLYYLSLAWIGPKLENNSAAVFPHRLVNVAIGAAALAAMLALGLMIGLPRTDFLAFAIPLFAIPALIPLAGSVNNDNLATAGGALTVLGAYALLQNNRAVSLAAMLAGVAIASAAKLTGLLLAGGFAVLVLGYLFYTKRIGKRWLVPVAAAFLLALVPYLAFVLQYGSPAPHTPGQIVLLKDGAEAAGWTNAPRLSLPAYAGMFVWSFLSEWMPSLAPRSAFHYAMLAIPAAAMFCAFAGVAIAARRLRRGAQKPADVIVLAGFAALAATFAIHLWFSHGRHFETGWMMDAYPRYYFPLIAVVPLAAVVFLQEIRHPRLRHTLAAFLIAGPLLFRLFGGPLGAA